VRTGAKSPEAFRTISEVADALDVPQHVLRFWETKFSHIKPLKRAGGRRYYRPDDVSLLMGIKTLLYTDGFTIKGVQKVLREQGLRYVIETGRMVGQDDRALPVSHSGQVITAATISAEVEISEQTIDSNQPTISKHHRARLSLILDDLLDLKSTLDGARAGLAKAVDTSPETGSDGEQIRRRA
jgi:DNA-binding transcriptional MerR regulator